MLRPSAPRKCRLLPGLRSKAIEARSCSRARPSSAASSLQRRGDEEGQPITDVQLASDGKHIVFTTGAPRGDEAFNPASLVDAPSATLWLIATSPEQKRSRSAPASSPSFSADGRMLLFKRDGDLWSVDIASPGAKPKLFAKGGASWSQFAWTRSGDLIFVDDRRGYSFLGRYRPHATRDRLAGHWSRPACGPCPLAGWRRDCVPAPTRAQAQHHPRSDRGRAIFRRSLRHEDRGYAHACGRHADRR